MTTPAVPPLQAPHPAPRILLIDNYDSFTYNLVQYFGELGADLTVWRNDAFTLDEVRALNPDAIVVSPGPCTPTEAGQSVAVIRELGPVVPTLGVCLGHQSIGEAFGAQVGRAVLPVHGKTSPVRHDGSGLFAGLRDGVTVTRYHSLVVRDLPPELVATAWTTDPDEEVVMALRHREFPVFGVQFHPESIATEGGMDMIRNFLTEVRAFHSARAARMTGAGA
ncbi:anthranilate synthase component II [Deinococcus knuensis]|uniref:Aminodeoxychorismate/anthranilate synthase component II n=1 Tax=Deinococcus knuensis TaxID=1837380 RepID=A0ABQ2SDU0_9DEIO|nr:aminodeoxychorismate/anthranilate synthase component II [Deinococcus knuensis]GGS16578.1 aminodeoxychorismate/anthranilate synthase component II [Deinococcus knuensis]